MPRAAAVAAVAVPTARAAAALVAGAPPGAAWADLTAGLPGGHLLQASEPAYAMLASPSNHRYSGVLPQGIVACAEPADIQTSIQWARSQKMDVIARCGGHNLAGYSTTDELLLDLSKMRVVTAHRAERRGHVDRITVDAGINRCPRSSAAPPTRTSPTRT